jgi:hypothetical protein
MPTLLLFGPVGGFHRLIVFGIFGYMAWDGENPSAGNVHIAGVSLWIDWARFVLTLMIWLGLVTCVYFVLFRGRVRLVQEFYDPQHPNGTGQR